MGLTAGFSMAQPGYDSIPARIAMVPEQTTLMPGGTVWLALDIELAPGWHTYWQNPGDSGLPTHISWILPEGFTAGEPLYPVPERQPFGPIINYGFDHRTTILWPITAADELSLGETYYVAGQVDYLVCAEICIPAQDSFDLAFTYTGAAPLIDATMAPFFDEARAALPQPLPVEAQVVPLDDSDDLILRIPAFVDGVDKLTDWYFFPTHEKLIDHGVAQEVVFNKDQQMVMIRLPAPMNMERAGPRPDVIDGVVAMVDGSSGTPIRLGFEVSAPLIGAGASNTATGVIWEGVNQTAGDLDISLLGLVAMAFLGGILLNLMPCVFPVLALKLFGLVRHGVEGDAGHLRRQGLFYALGVVGTMVLLGGAVLGLRAAGAAIGWGFQLQSPVFVGGLTILFFSLGLAMLGLVRLPAMLAGVGQTLTRRHDVMGSFSTGVLAVIAASPCTAPFMATAIGAALLLPTAAALAIFAGLGLGMALPLALLCFVPALAARLPKPGRWMETLQQFLAFPLFATALWLIFVIAQQLGPVGMVVILSGLLAVSFAVWLARLDGLRQPVALGIGLGLSILALGGLSQLPSMAGTPSEVEVEIAWEPYSPARLKAALANQQPVFIDATAAWCITCLVNERVVFTDPDVIEMFHDQRILYLRADWTNRDPVVTALLEKFGRIGLPLYVVYRPDRDQPQVLPQILSPQTVINAYAGLGKVQQAAAR